MMKHIFRSCTIISLVIEGMFVVGAVANAQAQCSNASLKGAYGFYLGSTVFPGGTPRGVIDRISFDGDGNFADAITFNDNGMITHRNDSGTYAVNADCTGQFFTSRGAIVMIVVVDAGKEFYQLNAGGSGVGTASSVIFLANSAKKQFPDDHGQECSNASLKGAYGFFSGQTAVLPAGTRSAALGRVNFDGKGSFTRTVTLNDNGAVTQIDDFGPYTVNVDCTGKIGILGGTGTIEIVLVDSGKEFYQLQTEPSDIVFLFTVAKKQSPDDGEDQQRFQDTEKTVSDKKQIMP